MELKDAEILVVKVGTSTLTYENGKVNLGRMEQLCRTLSDLQNSGKKLVLVSSGAIGVGMGKSQAEAKAAVEAGYWQLYRFNPELADEGKNPFTLDSKEPTKSFRDFLMGEVRYNSLTRTFPEIADQLFEKTEADAKARLESYKKMAE